MRFIADLMLGRLCRWLRFFGHDVVNAPEGDDSVVVEQWKGSGRVMLTRDRELARRCSSDSLYVVSDHVMEQLRQVVGEFGLDPTSGLFTRCSLCNGLLKAADPRNVQIPHGVRDRGIELLECPDCGKVYWEGTHTDKIRKVAEQLAVELKLQEDQLPGDTDTIP